MAGALLLLPGLLLCGKEVWTGVHRHGLDVLSSEHARLGTDVHLDGATGRPSLSGRRGGRRGERRSSGSSFVQSSGSSEAAFVGEQQLTRTGAT